MDIAGVGAGGNAAAAGAEWRAQVRRETVSDNSAALRDKVLDMLAEYGDKKPSEVPEHVESLQIAWLIHVIEERYRVQLDLTDDVFEQMTTVDGVAAVLGQVLGGEDVEAAR